MNSKNRQQKWIENHPVAWWVMNKIGDFYIRKLIMDDLKILYQKA